MSTTAVSLEELESERADLLPSRETLCAAARVAACGLEVFIAAPASASNPPRLAQEGLLCVSIAGTRRSRPGRAARPHPGGPPAL